MAVPARKLDLDYTLDDKYTRRQGRIMLSGVQALVRLPLMQRLRDEAAGLNTAGFISGYRGSPLGGLDQNLWGARELLEASHIQFRPGVNEDLAATMVWGSQQVNLWPRSKYDGVFGMWYGKGPGVDRSGDVLKHANAAGTSRFGGVLALGGDDHACRSSTLPHQSEHEFISAMMPILNPAGVREIMEMGLYGFALSRFTGRWVGFKTIAETVESSASVDVDPAGLDIVMPEDFELPPGGLNIRWPDEPLAQEMRMHQFALHAARAFARANRLDKVVLDSPNPRLGVVTTGKSYLDVLQALEYLGLDQKTCADIGLRVYKVAMTWPLEMEGLKEFAQGLEEILVVEEKRAFLEKQVKEFLYNAPHRPRVVGKYNERGEWILPSTSELSPARIAKVIARRIEHFHTSEAIEKRLKFLDDKARSLETPGTDFKRAPHFCSGCPHNTSTVVPEGSRAMAGIGCHYMTVWMDRRTETFTQMGGEGLPWIGQAPFTEADHVFINLGDGTYFHSGSLAIRALVGAEVNATFKILYNDAVAMTGGQPVDGPLSVPQIAHQVRHEGVETIVVVSDSPEIWERQKSQFPAGTGIRHRDDLDSVQKQLRETKGVTVLIYEQTCAAELRRRRKRGKAEDPAKRTFINEDVCEGCGDCGVVSNCTSIVPRETEFGRKRQIDQSSCNKDFSCVKGFCPSFVTIEGGGLRKRKATGEDPGFDTLPDPELPELEAAHNILVTGVGGTGVVTIGALIGMAAHLEGKGATVLDQTGLAQKGGAVTSHVRIAPKPSDLHAVRIAAGEADLVLGCDLVVAGGFDALAKMRGGRTKAVINTHEAMPGLFARQPDLEFPADDLMDAVASACGRDAVDYIDGTRLATNLMGDAIATNLFMLGFAWQQGRVPVSWEALERAIELNGVAIESNKRAFNWGRMAAADIEKVRRAAEPPAELKPEPLARTFDEIVERRVKFLTAYQNEKYAKRYENLVRLVAEKEQEHAPGMHGLAEAVARYYFKLMAYKDEYEVARLYAETDFRRQIENTFEGDYKVKFNLAPPLFAKKDPETGHLRKKEYGPWVFGVFRLLAKMRFLRGTILDPFGYTRERRQERQLIHDYASLVAELCENLDHDNYQLAVELATIPEHIRGYGHVKDRHLEKAKQREAELLERFRTGPAAERAA